MNTATPPEVAARQRANENATALVLCGGGAHGALEVGFARALADLCIRYDQILGTSIGALNGAFLAGGMSPVDLATIWKDARLWRLVRPNWSWIRHPRSQPGFLSLKALGAFLKHSLPVQRFENLNIPLTIVTTDLITGKACYWENTGDIISPLLASMSVPGIFPPIMLNEHPHVDGGIADNAPFGRAARLGFQRVLMIECACAGSCQKVPSGMTGILGRAFEITLARKHRADLELHAKQLEIFRIIPRLSDEPRFLDLSGAEALIEAGYLQSMSRLPMIIGNSATHEDIEKSCSRHACPLDTATIEVGQ